MNAPDSNIPLAEAVTLGAVDDDFFGSYFFPRTFRQPHPSFSQAVQLAFDDPTNRYVALRMFRGSAKTTRVRVRAAKHISYALSRVIMIVNNAQRHAIFSLKWLKRQVEYNARWARAFGLEKGSTWSDEVIEIRCGVAGHSVYVVPFGITGQVRGVNLDDFRPDFIIIDDPDNEETTGTLEQRTKTFDLIFGAVKNSLAPPTEAPLAKMVIMQTPLVKDDTIDVACKDPAFRSVTVSCFQPSNNVMSSWEERFPTAFLLAEKELHTRTNKLSLWMREMECKLIAPELASFREEWLQYYDEPPEDMDVVIPIDPASSDNKEADDQVVAALGFRKGSVYLLEYSANKGEMPDAAGAYVLYLRRKYGFATRKVAVETVAYQKILAWYLEKLMAEQRLWVAVDRLEDKRRKADRIVQEIAPVAASHRLHIKHEHTKFIQQYVEYSPRFKGHDDVLDAVAIGIMSYRAAAYIEGDFERIIEDEKNIPALEEWRQAP